MKTSHSDANEQANSMESYYQFQSKIYDVTRWSFLFGRIEVLKAIPISSNSEINILEVGCGTAFNTKLLAEIFPKASITAMEVAEPMVKLARKKVAPFGDRVQIVHQPYGAEPDAHENSYDVVLFSYSLTMINPQWEDLIKQAHKDLKPGGYIAVVDFHDSKFKWFKNHMGNNHVRMDGHLLPMLKELFKEHRSEVNAAYGGVWEYVLYIGQKPE